MAQLRMFKSICEVKTLTIGRSMAQFNTGLQRYGQQSVSLYLSYIVNEKST